MLSVVRTKRAYRPFYRSLKIQQISVINARKVYKASQGRLPSTGVVNCILLWTCVSLHTHYFTLLTFVANLHIYWRVCGMEREQYYRREWKLLNAHTDFSKYLNLNFILVSSYKTLYLHVLFYFSATHCSYWYTVSAFEVLPHLQIDANKRNEDR